MREQRAWFALAACAAIGWGVFWMPRGSAAAEAEAPAAEALFQGRPLAYWSEQALAEQRREDVQTIAQALLRAVASDDAQAKVTAMDALRALGPQASAAAPALAPVLDDARPWVSSAAIDALTAIGKAAVPVLVETFEHGSAPARLRASMVMASLGPEAREALPVLQRAVANDAEPLRERLLGVIAQIQGEAGAATVRAGTAAVQAGPSATRPAAVGDWPQFRGPGRDGVCGETGLHLDWPEDGPPLLWKLSGLGKGFSTVSIADGRLYTMGDRPTADGTEAQFALAYDLATRRALWATRVGPPHQDGPRGTPTVVGGKVYVLGTSGDLLCLEAATGRTLWQKNLPNDFGGQMMSGWKFSESPLVDGPRLICTPGGPEATMVALDKDTGQTIWKCVVPTLGERGKDGAGYASAVVAEIAGVRQVVQVFGRGTLGVEAATGRFLWGYNRIANTVANIPSAVVRGDYVFTTTSYKSGSALLHIQRDGDQFRADEMYFLSAKDFENHHGGVVLAGDYVYGGDGQNQGHPACLKWSTGEIAWKVRAPANGSAAVLYADGHLIFRYDRGPVALIEATPDGYHLKAKFTPPTADGPAWAHPVIHQGRLYLRHNDLLLCYDLRP